MLHSIYETSSLLVHDGDPPWPHIHIKADKTMLWPTLCKLQPTVLADVDCATNLIWHLRMQITSCQKCLKNGLVSEKMIYFFHLLGRGSRPKSRKFHLNFFNPTLIQVLIKCPSVHSFQMSSSYSRTGHKNI